MKNLKFETTRVECRSIDYRSGFVEVCVIHAGHVNLETWDINPDLVAPGIDIRSCAFPEGAVGGSTEIELTLDEARRLAALLMQAIESQSG